MSTTSWFSNSLPNRTGTDHDDDDKDDDKEEDGSYFFDAVDRTSTTDQDEEPTDPSGDRNANQEQPEGSSSLEDEPRRASSSVGRHSSRLLGPPIDFLQDDKRDMTWGRRIALRLQHYSWYNPQTSTANHESTEQSEHEEDHDEEPTNNRVDNQNAEQDPLVRQPHSLQDSKNDAYPFSRAIRETPSLAKAWAYFEHVALARFIVPSHKAKSTKQKPWWIRVLHRFQKANRPLDRAEAGEPYLPTKLYKPVFTPHKQLGDWGLGVGLYFSTLRAVMLLTLVAGLCSLPNMLYFASNDYNVQPQESISNRLLQASAICTDTSWVLCTDCRTETDYFADNRLQTGNLTTTTTTLDTFQAAQRQATFALRNNCEGATYRTGIVSFVTLVLLVVGMSVLTRYLNAMEVAFDEDEQTAQDYSILVQNPPGDATNAQEWHEYFVQNFDGAHATVCTIAVDNDLLVRSLVERRQVLRTLELLVESGTSLDSLTLAGIAAHQERQRGLWGRVWASLVPGIPEFFARHVVLTAKIQGLAQQDYPATKVFVTFETEAAQRRVLTALSTGKWDHRQTSSTNTTKPQHLFRGTVALEVQEPDEPNTVRWQDLNETGWNRMKQQGLTTFCTLVAIVVIALVINVCNHSSITVSAFAIALFNTAFPIFAKILTNTFEKHASEGGKQRSLYFKISLFRFVNTAVVISIITPFTATLSHTNGLISQVYALFFAEIVTTNLLQLADPVGHVKRHILAPRAKTQDSMNLCMQGEDFELAERYTNMTKILFLTVWYCAIYPASLFMCSFALFVNYFTDRFSLMRSWKQAPSLGSRMSKFSRRYFFPLSIVSMAVLSSFYWAGFPFDNLCQLDQEIGQDYAGTWIVGNETIVVEASDPAFGFCLQNFWRYDRDEKRFPFLPEFQRSGAEWMTDEQETVTRLWGWTSVGVIIFVLTKIVLAWWKALRGMFRSTYRPCGDDQHIPFSEVPSISAYIPQVDSNVFSYPLLACTTQDMDPELLDFNDPDRPLEYYDLTRDADVLLHGTDVSSKTVFSQVFHWPPPEPSKEPSVPEEEVVLDHDDEGNSS